MVIGGEKIWFWGWPPWVLSRYRPHHQRHKSVFNKDSGKGTNSKYRDYEVEVNSIAAIQPMYYTWPVYFSQPPVGIYNKEYPYNLVFFGNGA